MRLVASLVLGLFGWLGCGSARNVPAELVGKWQASGALGDPNEPGPSWMKEYNLRDDGTFVMEGYPPIRVTGKWKVTERDGNRFRVVLSDQEMKASPRDEGSRWADRDGWAVLEGDTLQWQGDRYDRTE